MIENNLKKENINKKVYIPTIYELYQMQNMGANVYKYLITKTIECIILNGLKSYDKKILINTYKYFRENPDIAHSICMLYPNEVAYSEVAKEDVNLCYNLLSIKKDDSIYDLDNLVYFSSSVQKNAVIMQKVISILHEKLINVPQYRFEYKDKDYKFDKDGNMITYTNNILNDIFNANVDLTKIPWQNKMNNKIAEIEPAYVVKFKDKVDFGSNNTKDTLIKAVDSYAYRYNLDNYIGEEYYNKDILTSPNNEVKRLVRYIEKTRK